MNKVEQNSKKGSFREVLGDKLVFWGKKIEGEIDQSEHNSEISEKSINPIFLKTADAIESYFSIKSALSVPLELTDFFRNRLALATSDLAYKTESYLNTDNSVLFVRQEIRDKWKESTSIHHPFRTDLIESEDINNLKAELFKASMDSLKVILNPTFHPKYQVIMFTYLIQKNPSDLSFLKGDISKEDVEAYRIKFADDNRIWGYKKRIESINKALTRK